VANDVVPVEEAVAVPESAATKAPAPEPRAPKVQAPKPPATKVRRPAAEATAKVEPAPPARVRSRLSRLGGTRNAVPPELEPVLKTLRANHPKADIRPVVRAYEVAERCHRGQTRRSGDPYITHPVAVATIVAELGMETPTLCAAMLHDTIEDTALSLSDLTRDFGDEVSRLVDGVTKLDKVRYGDSAEAETIRKMVIAMARDPKVLILKLADRLHNVRTLKYLPPDKQQRTAKQTLEIYAPLAHRLGMNAIKWELEDLSFATLYPKRYDEIVRLVAERAPSRDTYLSTTSEIVKAELKTAKIKAIVTGRPKHYYSIYQKMIVRGRDFADIYDLVGLRILVENERDCYGVLGIIHTLWSPVPGRFKDYIAMPKFTLYQSLHTTVIGPQGNPVEVQIRTSQMHRRAEYGIAAHWKYKESSGESGQDMTWLRQLVDWQRETQDPGEFLDSLRFDLHAQETFVFTPKGDVIALPAAATPVDFAYAVHTEVGHRCIGARVNGRLVPLESQLDNGDVVEVFTSKAESAGPSRDWMSFVTSPRARNKIRQWFARERREDAIDLGKEAISRAMRKAGLPLQRLMGGDALTTLARDLRYADVSALYAAVGEHHVSAQSVVQRLVQGLGGPEGAVEDIAETATPTRSATRARPGGDPGVLVKGAPEVWAKLARCCTPVPGDEIRGFVTRGHGVSVHRSDCPNVGALATQPERMQDVEWAPTSGSVFLVAIQVEALDRNRLLSDVTRVLSDAHVNILSAAVSTTRDRVAISKFTFEMGDTKHLGHLLRLVRGVEGVYDVYRVTSAA
jgi:GTP diphosphokinase / guanosine-3',5'-bis(diphosphate) 3'-diphosphatase